jgi:hypothetical protein
MEANLIPSPLRAVLGLQLATCSMQHAARSLHPANLQRGTCKQCNIQHATNMVAAMQHTIRCMPTRALVLFAFFGPLTVTLLLGNAISSAFPNLGEHSCAIEEGMRTTVEPITWTKITTTGRC